MHCGEVFSDADDELVAQIAATIIIENIIGTRSCSPCVDQQMPEDRNLPRLSIRDDMMTILLRQHYSIENVSTILAAIRNVIDNIAEKSENHIATYKISHGSVILNIPGRCDTIIQYVMNFGDPFMIRVCACLSPKLYRGFVRNGVAVDAYALANISFTNQRIADILASYCGLANAGANETPMDMTIDDMNDFDDDLASGMQSLHV